MKDRSDANNELVEDCRKIIARILALNPAGRGLFLIGGFRYRFIDRSPRRSLDIDYHWSGDLDGKQEEIISLLKRKLVPELERRYGAKTEVFPGRALKKQSELIKVVEVIIIREGDPPLRVEIDVDITTLELADPPEVRTVAGVVYPTVSDADMIESKVVNIFPRVYLQVRDLLDIFLFRDSLLPDSPERIRSKLFGRGIGPDLVRKKIRDIEGNRDNHIRSLDGIIREQVDRSAADNILSGGGAAAVLENVLTLLKGISR